MLYERPWRRRGRRLLALVPAAACVPAVAGGVGAADRLDDTGVGPPAPVVVKTHDETRGGAFVPVPLEARRTSPPARPARNGFVSVQVSVDANGDNIVGDAANEPSIAVDPFNGARMAIGWRQFDTIDNSFRQAGWGWSRDAGRTWTVPGVLEPGVFRSDPVLNYDADGNFFYNSLVRRQSDVFNDVFMSADRGRTWSKAVMAFGGDKQWMAIDRTPMGVGRGNIYVNWTRLISSCEGQFTRSYDNGGSFVDCIDVTGEPQWGTVAIGPEGEVYIAGDEFIVVKSSSLQDPENPPGFDFVANVNLGGTFGAFEGPNPSGLLAQAWVQADVSNGPTRGNVYLLCSVDPPGDDPLDVMIAHSTDGGLTWTPGIRVNDVADGWQWFGTLSIAPGGRLDAVWNDTRSDPGGFDSELYYAFSTDGGINWSESVALTPPWDPHVGWPQQQKIGDYYHMISDDVGAHLAYAATFNGEQDVYYLRIGDTDCNGNGVSDTDDIEGGESFDQNKNGLPDECECFADIDGDDDVGFADLVQVLSVWGPCTDCPEDFNGDDLVDFNDLLLILSVWGPCP